METIGIQKTTREFMTGGTAPVVNGGTIEIERLKTENAILRESRDDWKRAWRIEEAAVGMADKEIDRLGAELKANASMLARQCDLAREAETDKASLLAANRHLAEDLEIAMVRQVDLHRGLQALMARCLKPGG
jgi:hypothetical protein